MSVLDQQALVFAMRLELLGRLATHEDAPESIKEAYRRALQDQSDEASRSRGTALAKPSESLPLYKPR